MDSHSTAGQNAENIYGHQKRLRWIMNQLTHEEDVLELGCGTGYMVTLPLKKAGFKVVGLDLDSSSIEYGRNLAIKDGLPPGFLINSSLEMFEKKVDVIIVSEVLEHLTNKALTELLNVVHTTLRANGRLLVTVPNGYGWYEIESWLWKHVGLEWFFKRTRLDRIIMRFKTLLTGKQEEELVERHPSTFDSSPHVQRFTLGTLCDYMATQGFKVRDATGSVIVAGQLSNLFFTGFSAITHLNNRLGDKLPSLAAGFYVSFVKN